MFHDKESQSNLQVHFSKNILLRQFTAIFDTPNVPLKIDNKQLLLFFCGGFKSILESNGIFVVDWLLSA